MRLVALFAALSVMGAAPANRLTQLQKAEALTWIGKMKTNRRGPYQGVAWFCADGTMQPPKAYACQERGGGKQYGVLSRDARKLADLGIYVGTVYTAINSRELTRNNDYRLGALIVESYLERALDGWVLHAAKSYRGFRQVEDEQESARQLLMELAKRTDYFDTRRSLLMRVMRASPYGKAGALADEIRALAGVLGDSDPAFAELRFKIHAMPEPSDIGGVKAYAAKADPARKEMAESLAAKMTDFYDPTGRIARLKDVRKWTHDNDTKKAIDKFVEIDPKDARALVVDGAALIATAEKALAAGTSSRQGERNLLLLHIMQLVEELWIGVTAPLAKMDLSRAETLDLMQTLLQSAEIVGWLSDREYATALAGVTRARSSDVVKYTSGIRDIGRVLEWARARAQFDLGLALPRYQEVEPRAINCIDDMLRGSMILPLAALLDRLELDVESLKGGGHRLVGITGPTVGVRGQNPGIATGPLRVLAAGGDPSVLKRHEIVLLRSLPPELPPVAGVITVGATGSLSHVALLARNLGIPHASITGVLADAVSAKEKQEVVLGVSNGRRVVLGVAKDFSDADRRTFQQPKKRTVGKTPFLEIDEKILDLKVTRVHELKEVGPEDSGRIVGPKAAELGRLRRLFPDRVSNAVVIPFGAFLEHVSQATKDGGPSPMASLRKAYKAVSSKKMSPQQAESFMLKELEKFRDAIAELPYPDGFEDEVNTALDKLGKKESFGVFIRSDTNVEDLKDFTGAGLNKTVVNKVKRDAILKAIRRVWQSPYSERSYRWRQRILKNPESVYPSVILHKTVPCGKSGVMITADLETGSQSAISVSVAEGVAAVVDGGAPETVIIGADGRTRLLSSPRSTTRKVVPSPPNEGILEMPCEGIDPLLGESEVKELMALAGEVKKKIPPVDAQTPWDIEFGFFDGKAYLMQIRPLRTSNVASTHPFLKTLDARAKATAKTIDLGAQLKKNPIL